MAVDLRENKQWMESVETILSTFEKGERPLASFTNALSAGGSIIAWQIGVVSPGFLGLLWNAGQLSSHTHFSAAHFTSIFIVAELSFLLAILCSVVLHGKLTGSAVLLTLVASVSQLLRGMLERIRETGTAEVGDGESVKSLFGSLEEMKQALLKQFKRQWLLMLLGHAQGYLTFIGYVAVVLLIVAFKF